MIVNKRFDVSGKVVLVTGASSGLGAATSQVFARHGARMAVVGRQEHAVLDLRNQILAHGGARSWYGDLAELASILTTGCLDF